MSFSLSFTDSTHNTSLSSLSIPYYFNYYYLPLCYFFIILQSLLLPLSITLLHSLSYCDPSCCPPATFAITLAILLMDRNHIKGCKSYILSMIQNAQYAEQVYAGDLTTLHYGVLQAIHKFYLMESVGYFSAGSLHCADLFRITCLKRHSNCTP